MRRFPEKTFDEFDFEREAAELFLDDETRDESEDDLFPSELPGEPLREPMWEPAERPRQPLHDMRALV